MSSYKELEQYAKVLGLCFSRTSAFLFKLVAEFSEEGDPCYKLYMKEFNTKYSLSLISLWIHVLHFSAYCVPADLCTTTKHVIPKPTPKKKNKQIFKMATDVLASLNTSRTVKHIFRKSLTVIEENAANNRYLYRSQLGTFVKQITADEYTIIDKLMNLTEYSFYLPVIFKYGNSNKKLFAEFEYLMPMTSKPNCNMVIDMACDVLRALSFLHANNIIHRDVKPANIMMKQANQDQPLWFVLIDFGISVIFINGSEITMDIGTGMFKAPEVASGKPYDEKIDIYSLGATILYLLDEQQYTKQQAKAIETIKWESDILKNIIAKMVNEDPSKRPSADEALMILLDVQ